MIGTINIKVSASRPNMPLGPFHVFAGSAASFTIVDVPLPLGVRKVTGVTLAAKNVAGVTIGFAAVRVGSAWGVTVPSNHFAASGSVERGVSILATGIDDSGEDVAPWKLGAGDVYVMEPDGSVAPGETVHDLHWHDVRPENPVGGDVAPYDGAVWYFNGTEWVRWSSTGDVSHDDFGEIDELVAADSIGKVKATVNMVIRKLKGSAVAVVAAALCWSVYADALGPSTPLDDVPGTSTIGDIVRAGGGGGGGGADAETVAALVTATQNLTVAVSGLQSSKLNGPTDANLEISGKAADAAEVGQRISSVQNTIDNMQSIVYQASMDAANANQSVFEMGMRVGQLESDVSEKADASDLAPLASDARNAYLYSRAINLYMTANTNAWFAGTNYVFGADAATRQHFAWESGMDAATVPCSMALWENRDGVKQCVWDQRDWTAWYWSFKAGQMRSEIAATNKAIYAAITSDENHAWAKRYASSGRVNPDPTTTFIDTQSVCLSPGMNWETVATVGGCGYWTIVGDGAVIGGSDTNAVLEIKDFEGNSIMRIAKGEHRLAWLSSADFVGQMTDADGWVCFDMRADVQPVGYFSATLEAADFVAETDANCPAMYRWENRGGGVWRVHFLLKSGIVSSSCFAKFIVEVQGKTQIRYEADVVVGGALIFNGVKIAPVIPAGAAVGSTVTWKVVQ